MGRGILMVGRGVIQNKDSKLQTFHSNLIINRFKFNQNTKNSCTMAPTVGLDALERVDIDVEVLDWLMWWWYRYMGPRLWPLTAVKQEVGAGWVWCVTFGLCSCSAEWFILIRIRLSVKYTLTQGCSVPPQNTYFIRLTETEKKKERE